MNEPPSQLDGAEVLLWCRVRNDDGTPVGAAICQYEHDSTIYLFYCDEDWNVVGDTNHDSVDEATTALDQVYSEAYAQLQQRA